MNFYSGTYRVEAKTTPNVCRISSKMGFFFPVWSGFQKRVGSFCLVVCKLMRIRGGVGNKYSFLFSCAILIGV
jgi:hypothetical protein